MEELIKIGNLQYKIKSSSLLTQNQKNAILKKLASTSSLGTANCTTNPIKRGTTKNVNCTAQSSNPNPNFTYILSMNGSEYARHSTGVTTSPNAYTFPNVPFNIAGSIPVSLVVTDGCPGGISDTSNCNVNVQNPDITTIALSGCTSTIQIGQTCSTSIIFNDQFGDIMDGQNIQRTYQSANTSIAIVSSTGVVTGVGDGSTTITATSGGKTSNALPVTVVQLPCIIPVCGFTISANI